MDNELINFLLAMEPLPEEEQQQVKKLITAGRIALDHLLNFEEPDGTDEHESATPNYDLLDSGPVSQKRFRNYEKELLTALRSGTLEECLQKIGFSKFLSANSAYKCLLELQCERSLRLQFEAAHGIFPPPGHDEFATTLAEFAKWNNYPLRAIKSKRLYVNGMVYTTDWTGALVRVRQNEMLEIPYRLIADGQPRPQRGDVVTVTRQNGGPLGINICKKFQPR